MNGKSEIPTNRRVRPHEKLEVYRMAHALALQVHAVSLKLPKHELYEEGSQVRRSSKSISVADRRGTRAPTVQGRVPALSCQGLCQCRRDDRTS